MCFQSFDIVFEHLPGEMNVVADALSRVCGVDASDKIDDNLCSSLERCLEEESHTEDQRISNHLWEAIKACHNSVVGHHGVERTWESCEGATMIGRTCVSMLYVLLSVVCVVNRCQPLSWMWVRLFPLSKYSMGECIYRDYIEGLIPGENGYTSILVMIDILFGR